MNTTRVAGPFRLVCLLALLFTVVSERVLGDTYDGVIVAYRVSLEKPDPRKPFTNVIGSNGEKACHSASLHLADPSAQINNPNTRFYLSAVFKFRSRTTGEFVAISQPNLEYAGFSCMGRKYRAGYSPQSIGGAFNLSLNDAVWTDVAEIDPNPTAGKAWIYAVNDGAVVSTKGAKIKLEQSVTPGDGGAILMNPGGGDFLVHPDENFSFTELWVVGAEMQFSAGFKSAFNDARTLATIGIPYNISVECKHSFQINSRLNTINGCRTSPSYGPFRFPQIYCGTEQGPVKLELDWTVTGSPKVVIRHGQFGSWLVQVSTSLGSWHTLPAWTFATTPEDPFGEWRKDTTYDLTTTSGPQMTTPPPKQVFYRLYSPAPLEPPIVVSRP